MKEKIFFLLFLSFFSFLTAKTGTKEILNKLKETSSKMNSDQINFFSSLKENISTENKKNNNNSETQINKNYINDLQKENFPFCSTDELEEILSDCENKNLISFYSYKNIKNSFDKKYIEELNSIKEKIIEMINYSENFTPLINSLPDFETESFYGIISDTLSDSYTLYQENQKIIEDYENLKQNSDNDDDDDDTNESGVIQHKAYVEMLIEKFLKGKEKDRIRNEEIDREKNQILGQIIRIKEDGNLIVNKIDNLVNKMKENLNRVRFGDFMPFDTINKCFTAREIQNKCQDIKDISDEFSKIMKYNDYLQKHI